MTLQCRAARRDLLHRDSLPAVARGRLDVHLRRCKYCRSAADGLAELESGIGEIGELDEARKQQIFSRLVPTVHEIAWEKRAPRDRSWRDVLESLARLKPLYGAIAVGIGAIALVFLLGIEHRSKSPSISASRSSGGAPHGVLPNVEVTGIVNRQVGSVYVDGKAVSESGRITVRRGSQIRVDGDSRFSFWIGNRAQIALDGITDWQVSRISETFLGIQLTKGRLAVNFDGTSGQALEITTPESVIRVKGTVFTVEALPRGITRVGVVEGFVEVVATRGDFPVAEVGVGQSLSVPGDGNLSAITDDQRSLVADLEFVEGYPEDATRLARVGGNPERAKAEVNGRVPGGTPLDPVEVRARAKAKARAGRRGRHRRSPAASEERNPNEDSLSLYSRAQSAMTAGDIPSAIGLFERAIVDISEVNRKRALSLLAECYAASGKYQKAADVFDDIIQFAPDSRAAQNARYEVGRLAMDRLGNFERARAAFAAYVASPLGGALGEEAHYSLCELDGKEGAYRNALTCFNQFLRIFPAGHHAPDARLWRGALYQDIERSFGPAERDLLAFIRDRPRHPRAEEARYRVALGRYQLGDLRGSLRMINEYLGNHRNGQYRLRVERLKKAVLAPALTP